MNYIFRKATEDDAANICLVQQITWRATYASKENHITQEEIDEYTSSWTSDRNIQLFREIIMCRDEWLVVEIEEKVVGHLLIEKENDHKIIRMFYILPKYQNLGLGRALLNLACAGNEIDIIVDVVAYNQKAINFYKRNGFEYYCDEPNLAEPLPSGKTLPLKRFKKPATEQAF